MNTPNFIKNSSLDWSQYGLIDKELLASFWVKMRLDDKLNSSLDSENIEYCKHDDSHDPKEFWENTQFLILSVCGERESLMGELYNKLNRKISLHFDCYVSQNKQLEVVVDYRDGDRLFVRIGFPDVFIDTNIYSDGVADKNWLLNHYVANGYKNAERVLKQVNVSSVESAIKTAVDEVYQQIGLMKDEDPDSIKHLLKVAISYCYPTKRFPQKKFSAIVDGQYVMEKKDKELSCKGAFLLWKSQTNLSSFLNPPNNNVTDYEKHMEFVSLEKCVAKEGAKETTKQMISLVRKVSIKSAKAAIMSRNISHNLGSHVMSYLKQNFNSVQEIVANGTLETVIGKDDKQGVSNNNELPLLVGMGKFISYLQERQDYIATVSTDYIPGQSIVNFKDAIYDELNPDYRFYRHKDNWRGHKPANILLQNIAKSEGLSRELLPSEKEKIQKENNIIIQFRDFNGIDNETDKERQDFEVLRSYNFSLPGGIMGRQAIFSIVENVIRNAAKHGSRQEGGNLEFTFDIYDANLEADEEFSRALDLPDLYVVTLTDNVKTENGTINDINEVIKKSFYDEGTDLTASNKGIKEMIISAAWLRGIRIEEQDGEEKTAPILKARKSKGGCLQYVFCLPKVKKVAYLTSDQEILNKNSKELNGLGWYILGLDEYKNLTNRSFSFILLDKSLSENYEEIRRCSNNRLFIVAGGANYKSREIEFKIDKVLDDFSAKESSENKEKYLKEVEQELFKQMASSRDDEVIRIAISDANTEKMQSNKVKQYDKESTISEESYIYRTHNDSMTAFLGFLNSFQKDGKDLKTSLDRVEFIEGITGGNSTDRIVRREVKDDLWVYQQIHAMKTKVAIFDERIFTRITGFEASKLREEKAEPIDWSMKLKGKDILTIKNIVNNFDYARRRRIVDLNDFYKNWSEEKVIRFVQENYPLEDYEGKALKTVLPLVYHKKGIDVFTMTKINEDNNCFAVWAFMDDFSNLITDTNGNEYKNNIYGHIEKIAELSFDDAPIIKFS